MSSETSFFSRGIFINTLKNNGWLGVVYFLIQLFCIPLEILLIHGRDHLIPPEMLKHALMDADLQRLATVVVPVLLSLLIFRYLQVTNQAIMLHSLPVTRRTLFRTKVMAGAFLLMVPTVLTAVVTLLLRASLGLDKAFTLGDVGTWLLITLVADLLMFLAATLVGTLTGMSTAQGALTYIGLFLPVGLTFLVLLNLESFLFGFQRNYATEQFAETLSPLMTIMDMDYDVVGSKLIVAYLLVGLVFYLVAQYVYGRREVEVAGQTLSFAGLRPIFKYGVTLCCMLVGGLYFRDRQNSEFWAYFGYVVGSLLGYVTAEMLLKKTVRVFGSWKGYISYAGIMVLVFAGLNMDLTGYERRVPEADQIESVFFGPSYYHVETQQKERETFREPENIATLRSFHQQLTQDRGNWRRSMDDTNKYEYVTRMMLVYKLKDGSEFVRSYEVPMRDFGQYPSLLNSTIGAYDKYCKQLYESAEYKRKRFAVLRIQAEQIDKISIGPNESSKKAAILEPEQIKEVVALLQEEISTASYEELRSNYIPWGTIALYQADGKMVQEAWAKHYDKLEAWLQAKGYLTQARVMPEDISYIVVEKVDPNMPSTIETKDPGSTVKGSSIELTDKQQIEYFLRHAGHRRGKDGYVVGFYAENKTLMLTGAVEAADVPDNIKAQLQ